MISCVFLSEICVKKNKYEKFQAFETEKALALSLLFPTTLFVDNIIDHVFCAPRRCGSAVGTLIVLLKCRWRGTGFI